jgi:hypothetical protein
MGRRGDNIRYAAEGTKQNSNRIVKSFEKFFKKVVDKTD